MTGWYETSSEMVLIVLIYFCVAKSPKSSDGSRSFSPLPQKLGHLVKFRLRKFSFAE